VDKQRHHRIRQILNVGVIRSLTAHPAAFENFSASSEVIVQLVNSKCIPALLYGLEACF